MNICFYSNEGIEKISKQQYSLQDINILTQLGHKVRIATRFSEVPWNSDLYFSWWASGSFIPLIKAFIRRKPIIIIAGGNEAMLYKDSLYGTPMGYLATSIYKKIATRISLKLASELLVVSDFMVDDVKRLSNRIPKVVYNSVNTNKFCINKGVQKIYVTSVFNIEKGPFITKRGETFLRSIPLVLERYPDQKFRVIGRAGDAMDQFIALVDELNIKQNIEIVSNIENDDMPFYFQQSKIYIQLSDTETFGLSVAEAMSCGIPVLVSKRGALPELVGKDGFFVDHNDFNDVAEKIIQVLGISEATLNSVGEKLSKRIYENFSYEVRLNKLKTILSTF